MFNIVEKNRSKFIQLFRSKFIQLFAKFTLAQVERYLLKMETIAEAFHSTLSSVDRDSASVLDEDTVYTLLFMHNDSLEIYNCFLKNFPNPEGENQQKLKNIIEDWHEKQSAWGAEALMKAYQYGIKSNPSVVAKGLHDFQTVPSETKAEIGAFYRDEFLNHPDFINTGNPARWGARTNALIGLKYLGLLEGDEVDLFNKALEEGVIQSVGENSFSRSIAPLPTLN